jgi:DNA primase
MRGIDFAAVRSRVTMAQVLDVLGFVPQERWGSQVRGACPIHRSNSAHSRSFSANLDENVYRCFQCGSSGGTLELGAAVHGLRIDEAAENLCERFGIDVPRIHKW